MQVSLPWGAWGLEAVERLNLPASCRVHIMPFLKQTVLDDDMLRRTLDQPLESPTLRALATGLTSACIAVDDLARPTDMSRLLPLVIDDLLAGGIPRDTIRIVVATGSHAPTPPRMIAKKVGAQIAEEYRIEVHDPIGGVSDSGLSYGPIRLRLNTSWLNAQLRVVIGACLPHPFAGFGSGAKMIIPGLADLDATTRSHKFVTMGLHRRSESGLTPFRTDIERLTAALPNVFSISVICDGSRRTVGLVCGELRASHRKACELAAAAYRVPVNGKYDGVLINAYPKDIDLFQSESALSNLKPVAQDLLTPDAVVILTTSAWLGRGHHPLFGPRGTNYRPPSPVKALDGRDLWIYTPGAPSDSVREVFWPGYRVFGEARALERAMVDRFAHGAHVAVFPVAPIQIPVIERSAIG